MGLRERIAGKILSGESMVTNKRIHEILESNSKVFAKGMMGTHSTSTSRPSINEPYAGGATGVRRLVFPYQKATCERMSLNIDTLRLVIDALLREMEKNGLKVVPRYAFKCKNPKCEKEFMTRPVDPQDALNETSTGKEDEGQEKKKKDGYGLTDVKMKCDVCKESKFDEPLPHERQILVDLLKMRVNDNAQKFKDVLRQWSRDLEVHDEAYWFNRWEYQFDDQGNVKKRKILEMMRMNPVSILPIADYQGRLGRDEKGKKYFVCPYKEHRDQRITLSPTQEDDDDFVPLCPLHKGTQIKAQRAVFEVYNGGHFGAAGISESKDVYITGEIVWKAGKYHPSLLNGYSNIYSIWSKAMSLAYADDHMRQYLDLERPPNGILIIASKNKAGVEKMWKEMQAKLRDDPNGLYPLVIESEKGGKGMMQYIDLTGDLKNLDLTLRLDEYRRMIGAMYGVLPLFQGDLPNGWNNDNASYSVTNRAVDWAHQIVEDTLLDPIVELFNVTTWVIRYEKGEMVDEIREADIENRRITNASRMQNELGYRAQLTSDGKWMYTNRQDLALIDRQGGAGSTNQKDTGINEDTKRQGSGDSKNDSDEGGKMQGGAGSGEGTSGNNKSYVGMGKRTEKSNEY